MAEVVAIKNPTKDLAVFFDTMFGTQRGYIYCPTKLYAADPIWDTHFFKWPEEKDRLIEHALTKAPTHEVYFAPALLNNPDVPKRDHPENFAGSYWVWCEFDYGIPKPQKLLEYHVPQPQVRIRTSEPGHEHWYWRIENWQEDPEALRDVTRRLAYALGADTCFDWGRVLRVPYTVHHESRLSVELLNMQNGYSTYATFSSVPEIEFTQIEDVDLGEIPETLNVLLKYKFNDDQISLIKRKKEELEPQEGKQGKRSSALMRLAYECAELGMNNEEMFSLLQNRDHQWGKYSTWRKLPVGKTPPDSDRQQKELVKIINLVRKTHPLVMPDDLTKDYPVIGVMDLLKTDIHIEWVIPDLIHKQGLWMVTGAAQAGKSQLVLWILMHIAVGKPMFNKWSSAEPQKVIFFSGEMNKLELMVFVADMVKHFSKEEQELLNENLKTIPLGYAIQLDKRKNQEIVNAILDMHSPTGIVFDSFGLHIGDDMNNPQPINEMFNYLKKEITLERGCHVGFIHHNVKAQIGNKKPNKISDIYGSAYIANNLRTIIGLWRTGTDAFSDIELDCLKLSLRPNFRGFRIRRTDPLGFELVGEGTGLDIDVTDEEVDMLTGYDNDKKGWKSRNDSPGFELG